jgi:hypothetical protein
MKKFLCLAALLVLALGVMTGGVVAGFAASSAPPTPPPGQGDCSHGKTGKVCKPDPQPEQGKDCDTHGNPGVGGVNEDHCLGTSPTTSTDVTTTSPTTTNETTTDQTTTNETTTDQTTTNETTTDQTTTNETTTDQTTTNETTTDQTTNETTTDQTTNEMTSSATTTTNKTTTAATTTPADPLITTGESSNEGPSESAPAVTKPQLDEGALAKQAAKVGTGRVSPERNASGQLPFTGSSVWILALLGSAMLAAGVGIRRLTA